MPSPTRKVAPVAAAETGSAFVPFIGPGLPDVLCEHHERTVAADNRVSFQGKRLQIPAQTYRCHFIKARVRVHRSVSRRTSRRGGAASPPGRETR